MGKVYERQLIDVKTDEKCIINIGKMYITGIQEDTNLKV